MKKILLATLAVGAAIAAVAPAQARDGCGPGGFRGPHGRCHFNGGPGPVVIAGPGRPVIGNYYAGRGYYYNNRYWHHRERWHGDWRYR